MRRRQSSRAPAKRKKAPDSYWIARQSGHRPKTPTTRRRSRAPAERIVLRPALATCHHMPPPSCTTSTRSPSRCSLPATNTARWPWRGCPRTSQHRPEGRARPCRQPSELLFDCPQWRRVTRPRSSHGDMAYFGMAPTIADHDEQEGTEQQPAPPYWRKWRPFLEFFDTLYKDVPRLCDRLQKRSRGSGTTEFDAMVFAVTMRRAGRSRSRGASNLSRPAPRITLFAIELRIRPQAGFARMRYYILGLKGIDTRFQLLRQRRLL